MLVKRGVEAGDGAVMGVYLFLGMLCFRVRIRVRLGLFRVSVRKNCLNAEVHATRKYN